LAFLAVGSTTAGLIEAAFLALVAEIASALVRGTTHVSTTIGPLNLNASVGDLVLVALGLACARLVAQVIIQYAPSRLASDIQSELRVGLFASFAGATWDVQSRDREGHLQELVTSQAFQATQAAVWMAMLITALLTLITVTAFAFVLSGLTTLVMIAVVALLFVVLRPLTMVGRRHARELSRAQLDFAGGIGEASRIAEETHVFGVEQAQRRRIGELVGRTRGLVFRTQIFARLTPALYQSAVYLTVVAGLAILVADGPRHPASLAAVVLLLIRAGTYGQQVSTCSQLIQQALPFLHRVRDAQERYQSSREQPGTAALARIDSLSFDAVSFAYDAPRPVLSGVSFSVTAGEAVGVVGPSGAGKSTLAQIVVGLRVPTGGAYLVNGQSAEEFRRVDWRRLVAFVPQEPRLVHASVADNIRFFRDLDQEAVERAAKLAHIHEDIVRWSEGYDTIIGPRANAVSGGQQQRVCIARAVAAQPQVLVLDEPTSALDPHSESRIRDSLAELKGQLTLFVVAHRMSTLDMCDRVMVIVEGALDAFDAAPLLEATNPYYRTATGLARAGAGLTLEVQGESTT
jgi:ABC-type multidrug transport system fused ATPase/permease subunit